MNIKFRLTLLVLPLLMAICASAASLDIRKVAATAIASGGASNPALSNATPPVMEFKAVFTQGGSSRACWDIPLRQDLSRCAGIRLRFRCSGADLASEMRVHLQMDGGWYSLSLTPKMPGEWEELFLPKSAFIPEQDACTSWRECRKIRFAAWPGAPGTFKWQFVAIEFVEANVPVAMVRPGLAATPADKRRAAALYLRNLGTALAEGGIYPAVIDENDCSAEALREYKLLLMIAPDVLQPYAQSLVAGFIRQGGRAGVFYTVPSALATALGLPEGRFHKESFGGVSTSGGAVFTQRSDACIAVDSTKLPAGAKARGWWMDAKGRKTTCPAIITSKRGFWMTHIYLNQDPSRAIPVLAAFIEESCPGVRQTAAAELLRQARFISQNAAAGKGHAKSKAMLNKMAERASGGDYPGTLTAMRQFCNDIADENVAAEMQGGAEPKWRAAWIDAAGGLAGNTWEQTAAKLAAARLNAVMPCFLTSYSAAYPSKLVPKAKTAVGDGDVVASCLSAAHRRGIQVHPWMKVLSVADAPKDKRDALAKAGRLQRKRNGETIPWLCPVNSANRKLLRDLVAEMVGKYHFDGIHFDMMRYAGSEYCYCPECRRAFETSVGRTLKNWPDCIAENRELRTSWMQFRRRQITALAMELASTARKCDKNIKVSAAVYPDPANARDAVGQNWVAWIQANTVDFVCPMSYRPVAALFSGDITRERDSLGGAAAANGRLRPGIGMSGNALDKSEVKRQIHAVQGAGLDGFAIFEFTTATAAELVK